MKKYSYICIIAAIVVGMIVVVSCFRDDEDERVRPKAEFSVEDASAGFKHGGVIMGQTAAFKSGQISKTKIKWEFARELKFENRAMVEAPLEVAVSSLITSEEPTSSLPDSVRRSLNTHLKLLASKDPSNGEITYRVVAITADSSYAVLHNRQMISDHKRGIKIDTKRAMYSMVDIHQFTGALRYYDLEMNFLGGEVYKSGVRAGTIRVDNPIPEALHDKFTALHYSEFVDQADGIGTDRRYVELIVLPSRWSSAVQGVTKSSRCRGNDYTHLGDNTDSGDDGGGGDGDTSTPSWSPGIHKDIIYEALEDCGISEGKLNLINNGSIDADRHQEDEDAHIHATLQSGQSLDEGEAATKQYFVQQMKQFFYAHDYISLGRALHPIMDAYAPAHRFKEFDGSISAWLSHYSDYDINIGGGFYYKEAVKAVGNMVCSLISNMSEYPSDDEIGDIFDNWLIGFKSNSQLTT